MKSDEKKPEAASTSSIRPLWYWKPGGIPISATSKKVPVGVTAFCYEHDTEWTPIGQPGETNG